MSNRVLRSLVLACSLLLAAPQGWCCLFAVAPARAETPTAPGNPDGNCPCCPTNNQGQNPTNTPDTPTTSACPCDQRQTTLPAPTSLEQGQTVSFLRPPDAAPPSITRLERACFTIPPPSPRLHVLECVWLC
jgi:hypothetical protein